MDTLYYRKIAEIVMRDETDADLRAAAARVLSLGRDKGDTPARRDRRDLKNWMRRWCDALEQRITAARAWGETD